MCVCTPEIRTPWCGKPGCEMPKQKELEDKVPVSAVSWTDVAWIVKWTLDNARHLSVNDVYLVEKEINRCHLELMQRPARYEPRRPLKCG